MIPNRLPDMLRAACLTATALVISTGAVGTTQAAPTRPSPQNWHDVKCDRYKRAWTSAVAHFGAAGLSREFLASHAAFLASNCTAKASVCARTPEELKLANVMVVLSMNAGTASTFPPFYCRKPD